MPFAYIVVLVQLGYLAYWMTQKWGVGTATILSGVIGGVNVPLYEFTGEGRRLLVLQELSHGVRRCAVLHRRR